MGVSVTKTIEVSGTESTFRLSDLVELVEEASKAGIPMGATVRLHITRPDRPFDSGRATLSVSSS